MFQAFSKKILLSLQTTLPDSVVSPSPLTSVMPRKYVQSWYLYVERTLLTIDRCHIGFHVSHTQLIFHLILVLHFCLTSTSVISYNPTYSPYSSSPLLFFISLSSNLFSFSLSWSFFSVFFSLPLF